MINEKNTRIPNWNQY